MRFQIILDHHLNYTYNHEKGACGKNECSAGNFKEEDQGIVDLLI